MIFDRRKLFLKELLEERKKTLCFKIKKSIMVVKKMQNSIAEGCIKGFLIIC